MGRNEIGEKMKSVNFLLLALLSFSAFGQNFAVKPLTADQLNQRSLVNGEQQTFTVRTFDKDKVFYTGLLKPEGLRSQIPVFKFLEAEAEYPASLDLRAKFSLSPVTNQGSCGSCVYFASHAALEDTWIMRGNVVKPSTSQQYTMDCLARDSMCNGSWFETVAGGISQNGGAAALSGYPYRGQNQSCQGKRDIVAEVKSFKIIDNSPKSIIAALNKGYAVATTIGAGGSWMNYAGGLFNACSSVGTNHEMVIVGYGCETSVDAKGNCAFPLPPGVGFWIVRNSWASSWGDKGFVTMKMTDRSGNRCQNVAEEVGIFDAIGNDPFPPTPPVPPVPPVPPTPTLGSLPWWAWAVIAALALGLVLAFVLPKRRV